MMLNTKISSPLLLMLTLAGCSTSLTHERVTQAPPTGSVFGYYLPKQQYSIQVAYQLLECPQQGSPNNLRVRQSATVTEESVVDDSEHFYITYESLDSSLKNSTFNASLYPNGTIQKIGASVEDKAAETIKSLVSSGLNLARLSLGIPNNRMLVRLPRPCRDEIYTALRSVQKLKTELRDPALVGEKREAVAAALDQEQERLTLVAKGSLEPKRGDASSLSTTLRLSKDQLNTWFRNDLARFGDFESAVSSQVVMATISPPAADASPYAEQPKAGVVYREPTPAIIKVCVGQCSERGQVVGEAHTSIAQLGRYMVVTLENGIFDKNNVQLTFSANGELSDIAYGSEASLPKATGVLADTTAQLQEFKAADRAAETARKSAKAGRELKQIQGELDLVKAKADLIEARRRLLALEQQD